MTREEQKRLLYGARYGNKNSVVELLAYFRLMGVDDPQALIDDKYLSDEIKLEIELYGKTEIITTGREVKELPSE